MIDVRILARDEAHALERVADDVFDGPVHLDAARTYVADPRFHLAVAIDAGVVVGMASGVHYHHPDKPAPQLWIDEVGVADSHHRRGLASRLLATLLERGRSLGCREAWVLTERENEAAMQLYAKAGGEASDCVMFTFSLHDAAGPDGDEPDRA